MTSRKGRVSHVKEVFYIICILIFLLVGLLSLVGPGGYLEMKRAQAELETHRARIESLQKDKEERLRKIKSLRDDKDAIEDYARQKGYGKKGEVVQEVPQQGPPPTSDNKPRTTDQQQKTGEGNQKK